MSDSDWCWGVYLWGLALTLVLNAASCSTRCTVVLGGSHPDATGLATGVVIEHVTRSMAWPATAAVGAFRALATPWGWDIPRPRPATRPAPTAEEGAACF